MSAAIPVGVKDVLATVNLPDDGTFKESLLLKHQPAALAWLQKHTTEEAYAAATSEEPVDATLNAAFAMAYCFAVLQSALEFINLSTTGAGIIKSSGLEQNAQALLSGREIEDWKTGLKRRALDAVADYLNEEGELLQYTLAAPRKRIRATLIV